MKTLIFILIVLISVFASKAQTLEDYLKLAVDSNPGLSARYMEFEAAMQKIPQVKTLPDPTLSLSAFGRMIETRVGPQKAIFIFNQMFPWFGTLKAQGNAMASFAEVKLQEWNEARNELLYKVKSAWYPLYELNQIIKYQQQNKTIVESYITLAETRFKNGKGSMVDVIRTEIMLNEITTELSLLEDKKKPLQAQFNLLLNRDINSSVLVSDSLSPYSVSAEPATENPIQNNPKLTELDVKAKAWEQQQVVIKKQGMPKLGVGLNYTIIGKRMDVNMPDNGKDAIMPMVSLSLPVYRKKYRAAVKESELMQSSIQKMKIEVANNLTSTFEMTMYELEKAKQEFDLSNNQKEKVLAANNLLLSAYSTSGKDFEEVLRMQQMLIKYQIATASATKNYFMAFSRLEYLTGKN